MREEELDKDEDPRSDVFPSAPGTSEERGARAARAGSQTSDPVEWLVGESPAEDDPASIWEPTMDQHESGVRPPEVPDASTENLDVATAVARLEVLERSAERLRAWLLTNDLRTENPKVVEETVNRSLHQFAEAIDRRLEGFEKQLQAILSMNVWQEDGDNRPLGVRIEEALLAVRDEVGGAQQSLAAEISSVHGDVEAQTATQESLGARVERLTEIVEELAERRGLRRLAQAEERLGEEQAMLAERLLAAGQELSARMEELEARVTGVIVEGSQSARADVAGLNEGLAETVRAVREEIDDTVARIDSGLADGLERLGARMEGLATRTDALESRLVEAIGEIPKEGRADIEELSVNLGQFAGALREALLGSVGQIQSELAEGLTMREEIEGTVQRIESGFTDGLELLGDRMEGLATRTDALESRVVEAIGEIPKEGRADIEELSVNLGQFAGALREALQGSVGQLQSELAEGLTMLRERLESVQQAGAGSQEEELVATVRQATERSELASAQAHAQVDELTTRLAEFAGDVRENLLGSVGGIRTELTEVLGSLRERFDVLEQTAADRRDAVEVESLRTAIERLEGTVAGRLDETGSLHAALERLEGTVAGRLDETGSLHAALERIERGSFDREDVLASIRQAVERLEGTVVGRSDEAASVREAVERLEGAVVGRSDEAASVREAVERLEGAVLGRSDETALIREAVGRLQASIVSRVDETASVQEAVERLEGAVTGRIGETASVREVVDRIEGAVARGIDQTASIREVAERLEGLVAGRIDDIASVREAIDRIRPSPPADVLIEGLAEPVEGVRRGLEVAMVEVREGFATVVAELRQRIEALSAVSYRADEATLHTVREGIERMGLASREDLEGFTTRLSALEEGLRDTFLNSLGGIRMQLDDGMTAIRQRVDAVERVVADGDGEAQIASLREAIERVERASREDIEGLSQRFGEFSGTMNAGMERFVGALNQQLGTFAKSLTERLGTDTLRESLLDEIQKGVTSVIAQLRERIDSIESDTREQAAAVRALEAQIGQSLAGLTGAFEKLVGSVETLERWWGDPTAS